MSETENSPWETTKKRVKCPVCEWRIPAAAGVICDRCGSKYDGPGTKK